MDDMLEEALGFYRRREFHLIHHEAMGTAPWDAECIKHSEPVVLGFIDKEIKDQGSGRDSGMA